MSRWGVVALALAGILPACDAAFGSQHDAASPPASAAAPPKPTPPATVAQAETAPANVAVADAPAAEPEPEDEDEAELDEDETEEDVAWAPQPGDEVQPHQPLEFPENLGKFYDALAAIDDGDPRVVRVLHYGASMIGVDDLTSILRGKFQTRFGDGGAGMILLQRFMTNYLHRWVKLEGRGWDHCYIGYLCKKDGTYGLGGVTYWSSNGRGYTKIATRKETLGSTVSKFELWYAAEPRGGDIVVRIDGGEPKRISTKATAFEERWEAFDVAPGKHAIEVSAAPNGNVRAYGVALETDGPGITWEQFSWLGAFTKRMHGWDDDHIARQVEHRDPSLVAFTFGGNDTRRVANGKVDAKGYAAEYLAGIKKVMAGAKNASCLVIGMTDRGRSLTYEIKPVHVEEIVDGQRDAAREAGCAFFDMYKAMGGGGSMKKWREENPPRATADLKHLTHKGRTYFGQWVYEAIVAGYVAHRTADAD